MGNNEHPVYAPDYVTPPGDSLKEALEYNGMTQKDLADRIGLSLKTVNGIINGKEPITPETSLKLENILGEPASFWNNREKRYREYLARKKQRETIHKAVKLKWHERFPYAEMANKGYLAKTRKSLEKVYELQQFFRIGSFMQYDAVYADMGVKYRKSSIYKSDQCALSAWLRHGENIALEMELPPYDEKEFKAALKKIRKQTREKIPLFFTKAVELCRSAGVALAVTPHLKKTSVNGATRWLTPEKALIQISLKGKFEDIIYFTFFHECYHVLKSSKKGLFINENKNSKLMNQKEEVDADHFAKTFLIPDVDMEDLIYGDEFDGEEYTEEMIKRFAKKIGVAPAIVTGRLMKEEEIDWSDPLGRLRRKFTEDDIQGLYEN